MKLSLCVKIILLAVAISLTIPTQVLAEREEISVKELDDIEANWVSWQGKVLKLWFRDSRHITQIAEDKFYGYLYGEGGSVYAEFNEEGRSYVTRDKRKSRVLYARIRPKRPDDINPYGTHESWGSGPCIILIGSRRDKKLGGKIEYCW